MEAKNRSEKKYPISDKLATDKKGLEAFKMLSESVKKRPELSKRERYYLVMGLLNSLKIEKRLWRIQDGSSVE